MKLALFSLLSIWLSILVDAHNALSHRTSFSSLMLTWIILSVLSFPSIFLFQESFSQYSSFFYPSEMFLVLISIFFVICNVFARELNPSFFVREDCLCMLPPVAYTEWSLQQLLCPLASKKLSNNSLRCIGDLMDQSSSITLSLSMSVMSCVLSCMF